MRTTGISLDADMALCEFINLHHAGVSELEMRQHCAQLGHIVAPRDLRRWLTREGFIALGDRKAYSPEGGALRWRAG